MMATTETSTRCFLALIVALLPAIACAEDEAYDPLLAEDAIAGFEWAPAPDADGTANEGTAPGRSSAGEAALQVRKLFKSLPDDADVPRIRSLEAETETRMFVGFSSELMAPFGGILDAARDTFSSGTPADVVYENGFEPDNARYGTTAVSLHGGRSFASAHRNGHEPIMVSIDPLDLIARQVGEPIDGLMSVRIRLGAQEQTGAVGERLTFEAEGKAIDVDIQSSSAGTPTGASEGPPFALRIRAWTQEDAD